LLVERLLGYIQALNETTWPAQKIKCALLQASSNLGHLARTFAQLEEHITSMGEKPCALTVLSAPECTSLRLTMKKIVTTTLEQGKAVTNNSHLQPHDIRLLKLWQDAQQQALPVVIAVPNFEGFAPGLVSELIQHAAIEPSLDVCFMFGMPTSFGQYQTALSSASIRLLDIEHITLDSDQHALEKIIYDLLVASKYGLRLGAEAYKEMRPQT
jgi:hypothetical protein